MAEIYCSHFKYGSISSTTYNLVFGNVNTSPYEGLAGEITGLTVFNNHNRHRYLVDDDYTDSPLSFDIEIVNENGEAIDADDIRTIEKWLFNRHEYRKLYILDDPAMIEEVDGVEKNLYLNCRFINPEKLEYSGGIVGWKATLEADSGMWWQDTITKTIEVGNESYDSESVITIDIDTDIDDYTYPKVTVHLGETGGDFMLINNTDESTRITAFAGVGANASVIMYGEINQVNSQYYQRFVHRNFPRLLDGANSITVYGNVKSITFEYNCRRYF